MGPENPAHLICCSPLSLWRTIKILKQFCLKWVLARSVRVFFFRIYFSLCVGRKKRKKDSWKLHGSLSTFDKLSSSVICNFFSALFSAHPTTAFLGNNISMEKSSLSRVKRQLGSQIWSVWCLQMYMSIFVIFAILAFGPNSIASRFYLLCVSAVTKQRSLWPSCWESDRWQYLPGCIRCFNQTKATKKKS